MAEESNSDGLTDINNVDNQPVDQYEHWLKIARNKLRVNF